MSHSLGEVTDVVADRGADLKIILGLAVWMLSSGIAYLVGDIAFSSDIYKYMEPANLMMLCVIGGLVIAAVYSCWYLLRKEKRLTDILVPVCTLLVWGLARRKMLYTGGRGMIYSIAYEIKRAYGVRTGAVDLDYISVGAMYEFILFVTAVAMFFAAYMIFRCSSILIGVGLAFLFMAAGAMLDVHVSPAGIVLTVLSLIVARYVLMRNGQPLSIKWNVVVPLISLAACIITAMLVYSAAYERGVKFQGVLVEMVENVEYFFSGDSGKGYSTYYKVDGSEVKPTDEVVDEITRNEKPDGNLYVKARSYVVYDNGTWRNRDIGYSPDSEILIKYDSDTFSGYGKAIKELTKNAGTDDSAVVDKVVEYIRQHMSYTISPKPFASDVDPVLYALYTGHEGYCVHYASAAAIGLRTMEIPTKYNTGYVVPSSAWTRQADGTYHAYILEKYSHAWIEAYERDAEDWVIVDATPLGNRADTLGIPDEPDNSGSQNGQDKDDDQSGGDTELTTENITTEITTEITTKDSEESTDDDGEDAADVTTEKHASSVSEDTTENNSGNSGTGDNGGNGQNQAGGGGSGDANGLSELFDSRTFKIAAAVISVAMLLVASVMLRRRVLVTRRRRKLVGRNRIAAVHEMSAAMWDMLTFARLTDGVGSDDSEYADIVTERVKIVGGDEFRTFVACVQAAVYGQIVPDDEQLKMARKLYNKIRAYTYWSLNFKERLVWKYVKCYDCGGRRRKR